jgi:SWI/SNF-related matrix-associated actin-dependent regulator of chromatin subfamily A3
MQALRKDEPRFKVVVFTSYDQVQKRLVKLVQGQPEYITFEFNGTTPPLQRHRLIDEFQNKTHDKPCVFVVTYATAAVGITLTAATRVYLMEPAIDPAQEAQAAGRIHRLGQTKEVHIKRFAFRNSIDEAISGLHTKIKSGEIVIEDKVLPKEARKHFLDSGISQPHAADPNVQGTEVLQTGRNEHFDLGEFGYADGREWVPAALQSYWNPPAGVSRPDAHGFIYRKAPCLCCGRPQEVKDSLRWWGEGNMSWLNGHTGDPTDAHYRGTSAEKVVPSKLPVRPKTAAEAAALPGNDPSQAATVSSLLDVVGRLQGEEKVKKLKAKVKSKEDELAQAVAQRKRCEQLAADDSTGTSGAAANFKAAAGRQKEQEERITEEIAQIRLDVAAAEAQNQAGGGGSSSGSSAGSAALQDLRSIFA